jgi:hypothetical protein
MAGYAKSVVFPASSTLPELVVAAFGSRRPEVAYKVYVLVAAAAIPWLVACAAWCWRLGPGGVLASVALFLLYVWTDFPINYAGFGMLPYLLAIPLGLAATGAFVRYLDDGGAAWWVVAAGLMWAVVLVHFTSAQMVAPAAGLAYLARVVTARRGGLPMSRLRHLGVWLIPVVVLLGNAFWWLPAFWLASTKGDSGFAFFHPEGVLKRLRQIVTKEPVIEPLLCLLGLCTIPTLVRRGTATASSALLAFTAMGFGWGYLSGGLRSLDFLQPGRHTYAFYTGLTLIAGFGLAEGLTWLRGRSRVRLDWAAALGLLAVGAWVFYPTLSSSIRLRVLPRVPFLSSQPSTRLVWVVDRVKRFVRPGERVLYEEGGFALPDFPDPFLGGRYSGLLPWKTGAELIGGPYLHASLTTNFTQFGEGMLFGNPTWDREWFVRYARLYRPSAIVCWTPRARAFCRENPDLIQIKGDDGMVMIGRVSGFDGAAIEGKARVVARPGELRVEGAEAGVDGFVVLRYHSVPSLVAEPPVAWEPVLLEGDPVPFIRLKPPPGPTTFRLRFRP